MKWYRFLPLALSGTAGQQQPKCAKKAENMPRGTLAPHVPNGTQAHANRQRSLRRPDDNKTRVPHESWRAVETSQVTIPLSLPLIRCGRSRNNRPALRRTPQACECSQQRRKPHRVPQARRTWRLPPKHNLAAASTIGGP